MQRVTGIGGVFFRAASPESLRRWYAEHLGIPDEGFGARFTTGGPTVWAPFDEATEYFPLSQQHMVNYRVEDLDQMLAQLRAAGVEVDDRVEDAAYGRFGWAVDPEGTRFELWQAPEA